MAAPSVGMLAVRTALQGPQRLSARQPGQPSAERRESKSVLARAVALPAGADGRSGFVISGKIIQGSDGGENWEVRREKNGIQPSADDRRARPAAGAQVIRPPREKPTLPRRKGKAARDCSA